MVRADIRRIKTLASLGIVFCLIAFSLITFILLNKPAQVVLPENVDESIQEVNSTNQTATNSSKPEIKKQKLIYILHRASDSVSVVDLEKNETIKEIGVGKQPQEMFYDELTNSLYITNQVSNTISVIDLEKNEVVRTIKGGNSPKGIVVTEKKIYVTNIRDNVVLMIDKTLGSIEKEINVGGLPAALLLSEDQRKLYVLNQGTNDITLISTSIDAFTDTWFAGDNPERFAINPHERYMYITSLEGLVTILPIKQSKEYREMRVGFGASAIAFTSNNVLTAIVNSDENTLALTSLTREMLLATIDVGVDPSDVVITADDKTAYVSNAGSNTISIIDLEQKTRVAEFSVNKDPQRLLLR